MSGERLVPYRIIQRKRDGGELSEAEIRAFFDGYARGAVRDYHVSALLMAIFFRGLSSAELSVLVEVMLHSGRVFDLRDVTARKIDKHSTGGVGDKTSLVIAPLVSALGVAVPMISGRGLGHSGGTLDKLETIPGFSTAMSMERFGEQMREIGCAMTGQSEDVAPLDRKLYALRDVTGTVEAIPLIASSIMSKKLAEGIDGLVLDVKVGNGAFLPEPARAMELARTMIDIGTSHGCDVVALLTAMDRPLGYAIGNALEVEESILLLRGEGPADLREVTIALAAEMLVLGNVAASLEEAIRAASDALADGRAAAQMARIIEAQGGNPAVLDDPALLPQAEVERVLESDRDGVVAGIDTRAIGMAAVSLGAGRANLDDVIRPGVGFHLTAKPGDRIGRGEPIATVYAESDADADAGASALRAAIDIADETSREPLPLIVNRVSAAGVEPWTFNSQAG